MGCAEVIWSDVGYCGVLWENFRGCGGLWGVVGWCGVVWGGVRWCEVVWDAGCGGWCVVCVVCFVACLRATTSCKCHDNYLQVLDSGAGDAGAGTLSRNFFPAPVTPAPGPCLVMLFSLGAGQTGAGYAFSGTDFFW